MYKKGKVSGQKKNNITDKEEVGELLKLVTFCGLLSFLCRGVNKEKNPPPAL